MIEAQGHLRFGDRYKLVLRFVPERNFLSGPQTEQHGLIGQGNGRAPLDAERSEGGN